MGMGVLFNDERRCWLPAVSKDRHQYRFHYGAICVRPDYAGIEVIAHARYDKICNGRTSSFLARTMQAFIMPATESKHFAASDAAYIISNDPQRSLHTLAAHAIESHDLSVDTLPVEQQQFVAAAGAYDIFVGDEEFCYDAGLDAFMNTP
jgi:hypothetical protein